MFFMVSPSAPVIDGPTHGRVGIPYDYTFMSIHQNCNDLIYYINWGDDTTSEKQMVHLEKT